MSSPPVLELNLSTKQLDEILSGARQYSDEETCGLIGGKLTTAVKIYPVTNILHSPTRFRMDASEQVRAMLDIENNGLELLAIYHSHLNGPGEPSETDRREFAYPEVVYLIINMSNEREIVRGFRMVDGKWVEILLIITS